MAPAPGSAPPQPFGDSSSRKSSVDSNDEATVAFDGGGGGGGCSTSVEAVTPLKSGVISLAPLFVRTLGRRCTDGFFVSETKSCRYK